MPASSSRASIACLGVVALGLIGAVSASQVSLLTADAVGYFVADGNPRFGYQRSDRELAVWAIEAWAAQSRGGLIVRAVAQPDALVRVYWSEPSSQLFGEMRPVTVNGRRGAAVFIGTDMPALGPDIDTRARQDPLWRDAIVFLTCVHELGHALGLAHTTDFRDIMYFFGYGGDVVEYFARFRRPLKSRVDLRVASPFSEADLQRFRALVARK